MITFNKLKKIVKIWINKVTDDKERIRETTGGRSDEFIWFQTIEVRSATDNVRFVYIRNFDDSEHNPAFYTIAFDDNMNDTLNVYPDGVISWVGGNVDPGDNKISNSFSNDDIRMLREMIINADETIADDIEKYPKFDMDEAHAIHITDVIFKERDNIEIRFIANNRIFNSKNKLYIGFETVDENDCESNYVFKVTEKHIPIRYPWSLVDGKHITTPFQEYEYVATFHGYFRPTEEEILYATFRWVVSDEVIKTANKEARYT